MSDKKQKFSNHTNKAFTLVELIVVIVILSILATIAFLSFSSQSASTRDSARLSDISSIVKGLGVYQAASGIIPMPDSPTIITASGTIFSYQGYAGPNILSVIKISANGGKDPLDGTFYNYAVDEQKTRFQILGYLENANTLTSFAFPDFSSNLRDHGYADLSLSGRSVFTRGSNVGILLDSGTLAPVRSSSGVDILANGPAYSVFFGNQDSVAGSGSAIFSSIYNRRDDLLKNNSLAQYDPSLTGYWNLKTFNSGIAPDLSSGHTDGTVYNANISMLSGKNGSLFVRGNPSTYINIPGTGSLQNTTTNSYTMSIWINPSSVPSGTNNGFYTAMGRYGYHTALGYTQYKKMQLMMYNNSNNVFSVGTSDTYEPNNWYHLTGVANMADNSIKIYVNGILKKTSYFTGTLKDYGTNSYYIGLSNPSCANDWSYCFDGMMNDAKIYNRALTDSEVKAAYDAAK